MEVLMNVHLLVNELCEYQNARCNDKKLYSIVCTAAQKNKCVKYC